MLTKVPDRIEVSSFVLFRVWRLIQK